MKNYLEESKCLASLAVFRELYDSQKDIYGIISEFLKEVIISNGKYKFNLTEITQLLNNEFDFEIPEAVVKTSLKRLTFLNKSQGFYNVENLSEIKKNIDLKSKHNKIEENNSLIIQNLFKYIEEEKNTMLSEDDKGKIVHSFCSFILDDTTSQEYSQYVSAFIIKNKSDLNFTGNLSIIKEGVVLYSGLKYSPDPSKVGSWNTDLTIYLDTEILFHLAGYNGELYRTLFNEFYSFVREINQVSKKKDGKNRIHLKYFSEVKNEIENFFKKAENIINGKDKPNPSVTAMTTILDGCKNASDIISKKVEFYQLLKSYGIQEDDYDQYFNEKNHLFNLEDSELIEKLKKSTGIEDVENHLRLLNKINILRKNTITSNFENVKYILLTGNSKTIKIAFDKTIRTEGNVPLATSLSFLTNRFWYKLNKGFGNNNFPKNFDIISKAQILLSTQLNDSVGKKYEELQNKYKNGSLTEEQAIATIAELRKQAKLPENIDENDVSDVLSNISESSIEKYIEEKELLKNEALKKEKENEYLKQKLKEQENIIKIRNEELRNKDLQLEIYKNAEKERKIKKQKRNKFIRKFISVITIGISIYLFFTYRNKIVSIISIVGGILSILNFFGIDFKTILAILKTTLKLFLRKENKASSQNRSINH